MIGEFTEKGCRGRQTPALLCDEIFQEMKMIS
jgi:hypothetical protein